MGSRHLVSTTATQTTCDRCGAPILTGWAEGILARVEAAPIDVPREIAALLSGLATFSLVAGELVYRDEHRIRGTDREKWSVHAQHKCGRAKTAKPKQLTIDDLIKGAA